jgi:ketosteroid isomerase-like protein
MSQANVEVVKRLFESYRRGDYAKAAACLAPDVLYEVGQELPARGRAEVRAVWERWDDTWDGLETVPEDFLDAGGPGPRHRLLLGARMRQRNRVRGASIRRLLV